MARMKFSERQAYYERLERGVACWESNEVVAAVYGVRSRTAAEEEARRQERQARHGKPFGGR